MGKRIETGSRVGVARGCEVGEMGSHCLMGVESQQKEARRFRRAVTQQCGHVSHY